jgi:hypothetical protein
VMGTTHWRYEGDSKSSPVIYFPHNLIYCGWVTCHYGMARPEVADGRDALQFWRVAANILNK